MVLSRRQYIFQFEKWGINKYNTNSVGQSSLRAASGTHRATKTTPWTENCGISTQNLSHAKVENDYENGEPSRLFKTPASPTKRPQSLTGSLREKPPVPPKKRRKLAEYLASKNPYADLALVFYTSEKSFSGSLIPSPPVQTGRTPGLTFPSNIDVNMDMDLDEHRILRDDESWTTSSSASQDAISLPCSGSLNSLSFYDAGSWTPQEALPNQDPLREGYIDSSRPIDTFSQDEIDDMKRAADFLQILRCKDAFNLRILLFKRMKNTLNQPTLMISSALLSCARCAKTPSQIEIAQSLLLQKLDEPPELTTDAEKFLFRMVLAQTYVRIKEKTTARTHIEIAMGSDPVDKRRLTCLPLNNRSFDLMTYFYLTDGLSYQTKLREASLNNSSHQPRFLSKREASTRLLAQVPGPFELQDGLMRNPCLRLCLQWCIGELECAPPLPDSWSHMTENREISLMAKLGRIYFCLWERSQNHLKNQGKSGSMLWADQAENFMGIPSAQLLYIVCTLIMLTPPATSGRSNQDLVRRAHLGAKALANEPDEELGCKFITFLFTSWRLGRLSGRDKAFSEQHKAFLNAQKVYAKNFIEKKLRIKLPDVISEALKASTPRQSLEIVAAAFIPTLASSLNSSELASLRMLRDRIRQNVKGAMTDVTMTLPSSMIRCASRSNTTLLSMTELSAMASSLSLSSLHQVGSSTLNNIRGRVAEVEAELGETMQGLI